MYAAKSTPTTSNRSGRSLKRGVMGTYHNVSKKYLPLYLNEFIVVSTIAKNHDIFNAEQAGC